MSLPASLTSSVAGAENKKQKIENSSESTDLGSADLLIGIDGFYRIGRWTGIRHPNGKPIRSVKTRDGDGVEVTFNQASDRKTNEWSYALPGSEAAPLIVATKDGDDISTRFPTEGPPSGGPAMIPLEMPWIVAIGNTLGLDQLGVNELLDRDASIAVSNPKQPNSLPDSSLGYDGVDLIVLGGSSGKILANLSDPQKTAIKDWVYTGGKLLLTLGASTPELFQSASWLKEILGIDKVEITSFDPSAIETYTSSQTPLKPFDGIRLPSDRGNILLLGRTVRRENTPIAVEYNIGLGRVTAICADLDSPMFTQWPERMDLLTQITGDMLLPKTDLPIRKNRSTAYNDLAGQLRSSLDRFEIKNRYSFSLLSLLILAFLAAIGPLDYLLVNRLIGKPMLGWLSFPITAIGLSALLAYEARPLPLQASLNAGPKKPMSASNENPLPDFVKQQWNRLEVVDIDTTIQLGVSRSIHYLYSHDAILSDLSVTDNRLLEIINEQTKQSITSAFGYPGQSFGGIQIAIEDSRLPEYEIQFKEAESSILGMPLASRSSKGFFNKTIFQPRLMQTKSVNRRPGSELLQGELVNPLDVDILDGMLIYRNWTYLLPTRLPAGSRIASLDSLRQKNFRWQLSRQKALKSSTKTSAWNPADNSNIERISEMILFHEAAGGSRYTNLLHGPLSALDLSHVLSEDRCILFGRVAEAATSINIASENQTETPGKRQTYLRVILPVVDNSKQR